MQLGPQQGHPRSEAILIILAIGFALSAVVGLLPTPPADFALPTPTIAESMEILITGTATLGVLVLVVALPLAFLSAIYIHVLPRPSKKRMFTLILVLSQSPLFLWGFAATIPLLSSQHLWPMSRLLLYLSAVLGLLSFPRLAIEILIELESMPQVWEETLRGLGASDRQVYWNVIFPVARTASFQSLFRTLGGIVAEGSVSLLILGSTTTVAAHITGGLAGQFFGQLTYSVASFKFHFIFLIILYTLAQLGSRWVAKGGIPQ